MQDNINNENNVDNKDYGDYGDNLLFSIKNDELLIDGMNGEQLYKINNTLNKKYIINNNKLSTKKKSHKLNIKQIKKQRKEKKTKAIILIK